MLTWNTEMPARKTIFLDLNIKIDNGNITTSTYQKPMNLYLYLTASSNHSEKLIKAIIFQLMKKYKMQNSKYSDYVKYTALLYRRHLDRGHQPSTIRQYFTDAHRRLLEEEREQREQQPHSPTAVINPNPNLKSSRTSFLHFVYDRHDLPPRIIRCLHDTKCSNFEKRI